MNTTIRENNSKTASKLIVAYLREQYDFLSDSEKLAVVDYIIGFDRLSRKFTDYGIEHETIVLELCFAKQYELAHFDDFFKSAIKFVKGM